ncbi:hypothetical protein CMI47_10020 [Candidatus Pacearchaeota archaeon]|nr:hypothetical protein [Candidatus Pacearchaeota archaeon]
MSTTKVNRYSTTDSSYSLSPTVQSTNQTRPGFGSATRKEWTLNGNGTNSVTLNQTYSPPSQNPVSGASIIGLGENVSDSALQSYLGIPSTRCKAVFTGASTVTISASELDNRYDCETSYYTTTLYGLYLSSSSWRKTLNGSNTVVYNSMRGLPTPYTFPTRTLTNSGSGITMIDANQLQILGGNNQSTVNVAVAFDGSVNEDFTHTHASTGTLIRTWEGNDLKIDGEGGDNDPSLTSSFTISELSAMLRFAEAGLTTTTSIAEDSINIKFATANLTTTSSLSVTPTYIAGNTKELLTTSELLSSTNNLVRLDPLALSSSFTKSITPTYIGTTSLIANTAVSTSQNGSMIYDIAGDYTWEEIGAIGLASDYEWDDNERWEDWDDNEWGDDPESWDGWDLDLWARPYNLITFSSTTETILFKPNGSATLTSAFSITTNPGFNKSASATLTDSFTIEPTAAGIIDISLAISTAFSPTLSDTIIFDQPSVVNITGAFTPVLTANATFSGETALTSSFSIAITPTYQPGPYQLEFTSAFTQPDTIPSRKLGPYQLVLPALASTLAVGRLFFSADPYNIITIENETQTLNISIENRITLVDTENRVNNVKIESRTYMVPEETRSLKLRIPPISSRFTTPKERAEA